MNAERAGARFGVIVFVVIFFSLMLLITPKEVSGLDKSRKEIHADIINEAGIRGKDFAVCIIDDGIDYTHPNLGGCNFTTNINDGSCGRVIGGYDFGDNDNNPIPSELLHHGTHVAGIVSSDDDKYLGIAPESKIIAIKVEKDNGSAGFDTKEAYFDFGFTNIEKGLQWCINNATKYRIAVISMSVGLPNATSGLNENCTDYYHLQDEINNAVSNGISVIVASGNGEFIDGLYYPSCLPNVTSVGSYSSWKRISEFSNRGENLDLVAPGEKIRSTKEGGGFSNIFNDIGFGFWTSGTSFSAPHVTGAVLLMKQFDPALKPYEIEDIFKKTGDDIFDPKTFLRYKGINLQKAFQLDWPTYQHDNRRTGFTLLKGDMQNSKDVEQLDFLFLVGGNEDLFSRSVVSDMDNDGDLETVFFSVYGTPEHPEGWLFVIETDKEGKILRENKIGELFVGDAANGPPVVANTDGDAEKEIVVGLANGTVYLIDAQPSGDNLQLSKRWSYTVPAHYSPRLADWVRGGIGIGIVAQDLDYDGRTEIIFTDELSTTVDDWDGGLYVLRDNGNTYAIADSIIIGNGGSIGGVSVANLDDDDNLEIIVSTYYGIKVFDFANNELQLKWANSFGVMEGAPVVYDYDRDNTYEILVSTTSYYCSVYRSCADTFYAFDGATGNLEKITGLGFHSPTTVALANLDQDTNTEAALSFRYDPEEELGGVVCIDIQGQRIDCEYTNGRTFHSPNIAPVIADIDGNGDNEIIIPENNKSILHVINGDGTQLFNYSFGGLIGSSPAIADIDDDGKAEIVVKRAGSPYSIMATLGSNNHQPYLEPMKPVIAIAGQTASLQANASDPDNDTLTLYYSAPFNETGQWLPTNNDTGDYTILVEVSDGNLSHHQYVPVKVLPEGTQLINVFADGSFNKTLVFTEAGQVQRVTIKIPKKAQLIYGTMKIEGEAS